MISKYFIILYKRALHFGFLLDFYRYILYFPQNYKCKKRVSKVKGAFYQNSL